MFSDLRDFIEKCRREGQLKEVAGADWNLELGIITEIEAHCPDPSMLLFDKIGDYPAGFRVASNSFASKKRLPWVLGFADLKDFSQIGLIQAWRERMKEGVKPLPPVEVSGGPVKENVRLGDDVNLLDFPIPKWHELDGGRYIGTADLVINQDPESGWVNLGTYRVQVQDKSTVTIHMSPGRHCELIASKYWSKGLSCPVAISCGHDPSLWAGSSFQIQEGISEYDWVGWLRGAPVEVTKGVVTGLPVPATAEIVLEGDFLPPDVALAPEGPFGEWPGHYGKGRREGRAPIVKIKGIMHRNNPIILGSPPLLFAEHDICTPISRAAGIWDELDRQVPGVKGVSIIEEMGPYNVVVSLEQKYVGHAKQAAMAVAGCRMGAYMAKYIVVVDDDIDPSDIREVLWAISSRTDPEVSIDIIRGCWGSQTDPFVSPQKRAIQDYTHGTAIILACKPYHWIKDFPPTIKTSPDLLKKVKEKWSGVF